MKHKMVVALLIAAAATTAGCQCPCAAPSPTPYVVAPAPAACPPGYVPAQPGAVMAPVAQPAPTFAPAVQPVTPQSWQSPTAVTPTPMVFQQGVVQ